MARQNNLCGRYQTFVQSHFHGVSRALMRAVRTTVSLCSEQQSPPPAAVVDIIYKIRDLENHEGGWLYTRLTDCLRRDRQLAGRNSESTTGTDNNAARTNLGTDYDSPTACSSEPSHYDEDGYAVDDGTDEDDDGNDDEEQQQEAHLLRGTPLATITHQQAYLERQRRTAKRAFLSAVFIEGTKPAAIEDMRETLRRHYVLGRDPFCYDAHTHEPTGIGTETLPNVPPSLSTAEGGAVPGVAPTGVVILYYYIF